MMAVVSSSMVLAFVINLLGRACSIELILIQTDIKYNKKKSEISG